jgi:hypothetical protein
MWANREYYVAIKYDGSVKYPISWISWFGSGLGIYVYGKSWNKAIYHYYTVKKQENNSLYLFVVGRDYANDAISELFPNNTEENSSYIIKIANPEDYSDYITNSILRLKDNTEFVSSKEFDKIVKEMMTTDWTVAKSS